MCQELIVAIITSLVPFTIRAGCIDFWQAQSRDHHGCIVGQVLDELARSSGGRGAAPTVIQNHLAPGDQRVGYQWFPVIHPTAEVLKEP